MNSHSHIVRFPTSSKYRNKPTVRDGIKFDSMKEAARYQALKLLEKNGEVADVRLQQTYEIRVNGKLICKYRADFTYRELRNGAWREVVEDVKGYRTAVYRLKRKLMLAVFGIVVLET